MKLVFTDLQRRALCVRLLEGLRDIAPGPADLAAIAVELSEMARESIAHICDQDPTIGTREQLFAELTRVQALARRESQATTDARRAQIATERGPLS